ncbi:MAG: carbamoyltransferase HypF [Marmoricola sp.]|nr:carbamoyltransferase HypF [Marmoricola sp.]
MQGVGFRPHVYSLARSLDLSGGVWNDGNGVVAEVEGDPAALGAFGRRVETDAPPLASVSEVSWTAAECQGGTEFNVRASESGPGRTFVSPDVTICEACLDDLRDPGNRRHRHPFVTCTSCGPRFTITTALPYDRPTTTMAGFPMCAECAAEYADPSDRRFHAQTICCPACGPRLSLAGPDRATAHGEDALAEARRLLVEGAVVAVKGLGGYHLACDATNETAVITLRKRKRRGDKPFAVMVADQTVAERFVRLSEADAELLTGRSHPVVLAPRVDQASLSKAVAPGSADVGVMLAYTPLHHLLLGLPGDVPGPEVLVMTSGNLAGEPIVIDEAEALHRLSDLADAWLTHDRPIHVPCDDSVTRTIDGRESPIRRSRGQAPLPLDLPFETPAALGVGADLKNTFCLAEGRLAWMSAHVGDMGDLSTLLAYGAAEQHLEMLTGVRPAVLAADRHPAYHSRSWALSQASGRPVAGVQHHHAHVAATMADNRVPDGVQVLGVAFDGTGYGEDGAVWGGEFLVADYHSFVRATHLAYVALPGGDAGVRNPNRMALSHLRSAGVDWDPALPCVRASGADELALLDKQLGTGFGCAPTSSMGRLFDAVASIAGICHRTGYDAQAAMELEALARRVGPVEGYRFGLRDSSTAPVDPGPVIRQVASDVLSGAAPELVAARFQQGVVDMVLAVLRRLRDQTGLNHVTLSGGVFLNSFLTSRCASALAADSFEALQHHRVPASDAGIALGQVAVLAHLHQPPRTTNRRPQPSEMEMPCA